MRSCHGNSTRRRWLFLMITLRFLSGTNRCQLGRRPGLVPTVHRRVAGTSCSVPLSVTMRRWVARFAKLSNASCSFRESGKPCATNWGRVDGLRRAHDRTSIIFPTLAPFSSTPGRCGRLAPGGRVVCVAEVRPPVFLRASCVARTLPRQTVLRLLQGPIELLARVLCGSILVSRDRPCY